MSLTGHFWTLESRLRSPEAPAAEEWEARLADERWGTVRLTGKVRHEPGARGLLLVVHGIAGCAEAGYVQAAAQAASAAALSCLRLNLRGCDRLGEDLYHGGLASDLAAALASPAVAPYECLYALGYSMGGHLALCLACSAPDRRLAAVAAVCAPLDLAAGARYFDRQVPWPYRRFILGQLNEIYAAVAAVRPLPLTAAEAARLEGLEEWDDRITAPRWGFGDAATYYRRASVAGRLSSLAVPALLVASESDPMVPPSLLEPVLAEGTPDALEVRWVDGGGHVGFPPGLDLGEAAPPGLAAQVLGWLLRQGGGRGAGPTPGAGK
jgi:predicted alpha/beta-fold hydrolase